jgi:hypothetical protein
MSEFKKNYTVTENIDDSVIINYLRFKMITLIYLFALLKFESKF